MPAHLSVELMSIPLVGVPFLWVRLEVAVCLGAGSLGNLFTDVWGCDPTWIVVWPGASQC